jgi:lipoyl(octanoyl) transferase
MIPPYISLPPHNHVEIQDCGQIDYQIAWTRQEHLLKTMIENKMATRQPDYQVPQTVEHHFLLCEHPPVYTLGRNGKQENLLLNAQQLQDKGIQFYKINRGGDITFHGPGQIVGYPILDLDHFFTDIGRYIRSLEEVVIRTLAEYGLQTGRIEGLSGVWLDGDNARARKICAIGVHLSRWITMHGFALNVNTPLEYFTYIVPCGITDKAVTSMEKELGHPVDLQAVKARLIHHFAQVFNIGAASL